MILLLALAFLLAGSDPVTHITAKETAAALEKQPFATLTKGDNHTVMLAHRTSAGQSELHEHETDVFYIVDGSATFTTGGTIVAGKTTAPNEIRGTGIQGGNARRIAKGDVLTIPAGTPHWFSGVQGSVTYFIVKVPKKAH